ncbi:MAG: DUF4382 domain-containing protein [Bacteroidota bacterium]
MKKNILILMGTAFLLAIIGCSNSSDTNGSGTGTMEIRMVDSPAVYDAVHVVIDSVQAHISTGDSVSAWTTLNRTAATYNLLELVNGASAVIGTAVLPVGHYSQIRLYVGTGSTVVVDGVTHPLSTPSGSQSGIKLNVNATIIEDATYVLTIDFDANKSIVVSGNSTSPTYHLKPVIRALATGTTGFISGIVLPLSADPALLIYNSAADSLTTATDLFGGFKFLYVQPGTYTLVIASGDDQYYDSTIAALSVTALNTVNLGTIMLRHK